MKNNKVFSITVICITLLVTYLFTPPLVHASPDYFNMYVTMDEGSDAVALKVYLADNGRPLSEATVEYELFTAQGLPLGVKGEMEKAASGMWCSSPLPLTGNQGEVCAVVRASPRRYLPQEKRYYFPAVPATTPVMDESYNPEQEKLFLGTLAIRQEFVWDDDSGTFQTVNLYAIGEVEDYIADMEQVLTRGAAGGGLILGRDCELPYYYWQDGASWHTLADRTRYKGYDARAEAVVSRGDNLYTQEYADGYTRVASYEPWAAIVLANGWKVDVTQEYTQWGHEVKITAPISSPSPYRESWIYGDPHLLQAGGTQQQELAAIGEYVFDLGGYTLTLFCMKSNAGFSLVTAMNITNPNGYLFTMGRNGEVKISGGSDGDPQAIPSLSGDPEIEFIEAPTDGATLNSSKVIIKVEANEFLQQATLHFGEDSYPMTDMDGDKGLRWEKSLSGLIADTYLFHVTGVDLGDDPGTSSEWQVRLEAGNLCVEAYGSIQAAIDAALDGATIQVPTGTYYENITIDKSLTLQGGWSANCSSRISTDPADTIIDGGDNNRVITIDGSYNVTIEGLTIRNGDASGLGGGTIDADAGGGIYARNTTLAINNCNITGNVASNTGLAYGGGAYLENLGEGSQITDCNIKDNFAAGDIGILSRSFGGGLYIKYSTGITVTGNTIEGNIASLGDQGKGGGVYAFSTTMDFSNNQVLTNTAGSNWGAGGGLYLEIIHGQVNDNIIQGNVGGQNGTGGGARIEFTNDVMVHGNTITGNTASQTGDYGYGGGMDIFTSGITLSANTITGNKASEGGTATEWGGGLFLHTILNLSTSLNNNIVAQNEAADGAGIYIVNWGSGYADNYEVNLYHNTLADNSGDGVNCAADGRKVTLAMTNNIVSGNSMGISTTGTVNATIDHTLFFNNTDDGIIGSNPVYGDPSFVGGENYHITASSAALDAGVDAGIAIDIDGQTRPQGAGYDIGADEHLPGIVVTPTNLDFGSVTVGENPAAQEMIITNNGDANLTYTISDYNTFASWNSLDYFEGACPTQPWENNMLPSVSKFMDCPWLSENPTSGSVEQGNSNNITVSVNVTGLSSGDYTANIEISSNDPVEPEVVVPVILHVTTATLMEGDATLNDCVSISDAMFIAQYKAGLRTFDADQLMCADTTDDGNVSMVDAMHIAQWLVDPEGELGVLFKPLWESPADDAMLHPEHC